LGPFTSIVIVRSSDRCLNLETDRGGSDRVIPLFGTVSSTRSALNNISAPAGYEANRPTEMASLKTHPAMLMNEEVTVLATAAKYSPLQQVKLARGVCCPALQ
jgi:hypothetical protein